MGPGFLIRVDQLLFLVTMCDSKIGALNRRQINYKDSRFLVLCAIKHTGVQLPIDVLSRFGLETNQQDCDGRVSEIIVSYLRTDSLIVKILINVSVSH